MPANTSIGNSSSLYNLILKALFNKINGKPAYSKAPTKHCFYFQ